MTVDEQAARQTGRGTAASGITFVVLLLVSAGMASVPGGDDQPLKARHFYTEHTGVITIAQVIGLVAAAVFIVFAWSLRKTWSGSARASWIAWSGYAVAAAAVVTVVPVLWLCVVADSASLTVIHRLTQASDWVDVLLFAAIAAFASAVALVAPRAWLRWLAWVVAAVALARAVLLAGGSEFLGMVGPLAFIVLVLATSIAVLVRPRQP